MAKSVWEEYGLSHKPEVVSAIPGPSCCGSQQVRASHTSASNRLTGSTPNLFWGHTTMSRLRSMPFYRALPPIEAVAFAGPSSFKFVRQGTALWRDLHEGTLTTSRLAAALGLREENVVKFLRLPRSMSDPSALDAVYYHLRRQPMNDLYSVKSTGESFSIGEAETFNYAQVEAYNEIYEGCDCRSVSCVQYGSIVDVRLAYGSIQEASALRHFGNWLLDATHVVPSTSALDKTPTTATPQRSEPPSGPKVLGFGSLVPSSVMSTVHLQAQRPRAVLEEVGLCIVDLEPGRFQIPRIGASPDGRIIRVGTYGTRETVEVKCVCPFIDHDYYMRLTDSPPEPNHKKDMFGWFDRGPYERVMPLHIPQLQMEMLADNTQVANYLSYSKTKGSNLFRVERNESYILRMLSILEQFYIQYVLSGAPPPRNMFYEKPEYQEFLLETYLLCEKATTTRVHLPPETHKPDSYFLD
eukprot:Rmarinus@m.15634